jgi:hypothetical protein
VKRKANKKFREPQGGGEAEDAAVKSGIDRKKNRKYNEA